MVKLLTSLVIMFCCYFSSNGESAQDHLARERIKLACKVQILPLTTQVFDECIKDNGMPYNLKQIFTPCSEIAGIDFNSYEGIFNFTCKEMGKNRPEVITCVVNNIGSSLPTMNIIDLSQKALHIAKVCSELVAKALAEEVANKAKDLASKAMGNLKMPKFG